MGSVLDDYAYGQKTASPNSGKTAAQIAADAAYTTAANAVKNAKKPTKAQINALKDSYTAKTAATPAVDLNAILKEAEQAGLDTDAAIAEATAAADLANSLTEEAKTLTTTVSGGSGTGTGTGNGNGVTDTKKADAYQRLYDEFNTLGLGALVSDAKDLLMKATSISAMPDALRGTKAYTDRFSANDARIKAGLAALSPAEYLAKEDAYQNIMRNYGLPESYYKTGLYGKQEGFDKLLANDVSALELEDRIATAQQRVINSNPEVLSAIKNFYGDSVTNGDILAYALNPQKGLEDIKKKVTAAEIQGAANVFGLNKITKESTPAEIAALEARANALAGYGVTKATATEGYANVAEMAPRGGQLAAIYGESPYTQGTAEAEVFNTTGAAEAKAKRKKLTQLETANFSGSSGVGALSRDRANPYGTTQSGYGQY